MAGENLTYREFFRKLSEETNNKPLLIRLPKTLLITAGYFGDALRRLGIKTEISSVNMKILCVKNYYAGEKAAEELGIEFGPVSEGVEDAITWFKRHKMIKA
jgi:hypothetical protein